LSFFSFFPRPRPHSPFRLWQRADLGHAIALGLHALPQALLLALSRPPGLRTLLVAEIVVDLLLEAELVLAPVHGLVELARELVGAPLLVALLARGVGLVVVEVAVAQVLEQGEHRQILASARA
jgi:hypothetical protein